MADGGIGSSGDSGGDPRDLSQPLVQLLREVERDLSRTFDDTEAFVQEIFEAILDLPPDQRFRESADIVKQRIEDRFGSADVFDSKVPMSAVFARQLLLRFFDSWLEEHARETLQQDTGKTGPLLIHTAGIGVLHELIDSVEPDENSRANNVKLFSAFLALYARIYHEHKHQRSSQEAFIDFARDIGRARVVLLEVHNENSGDEFQPNDWSDERTLQETRAFGALLVYSQFEISVGRGAELAGMTQDEFVDYAKRNGIEPQYGPESTDDLYSGPDL